MVTVYCEQYGLYWKIPPKEFLAICAKAIKTNNTHTIPNKYQLKGKPVNIIKSRGRPDRDAFSTKTDVLLYHPLDWGRDDYIGAYREVATKLGIRSR